MLPCIPVSLYYGGERPVILAVLGAAGVCGALGLVLFLLCGRSSGAVYAREGFVIAGVGWVLVSLLGGLPFFFSGQMPYSDAFFESVAGFTTTGTFLRSDMESWYRGLLFWRNFIQWLGGIGVLAFVLAVIRGKSGNGGAFHMFRAESPGPTVGKVMPKIRDSIQSIYLVYIVLSVLNLVFLLAGGMPVFDALCTMFGTAGTGGFGVKSDSMASYSPYLQGVCTVFMGLFGVNFALYYLLLRGNWRAVLKDEELRLYAGLLVAGALLITLNLVLSGVGNVGSSLHNSTFMVNSVITSTGLSIADYAHWPAFSRAILFILMIIGAMGGSTAGGFKVGRLLILLKSLRGGLYRLNHPRSVTTVRLSGKPLEPEAVGRTQLFLSLYSGIILAAFLLISVDGLPLEMNLTAVIACVNNVGPGFGLMTSVAHFGDYGLFSKLVLSVCMLVGRLEIFPILLLLTPSTWKLKT